MKHVSNIFIIFLIGFFLSSCGGFKLKKKSSSGEEFLIDKKDPLILPPDFSELPKPNERIKKNNVNEKDTEDIDLKKVFNGDDNNNSNNQNEEDSSEYEITKSILEKIQ